VVRGWEMGRWGDGDTEQGGGDSEQSIDGR
jgi:hypothetical protein